MLAEEYKRRVEQAIEKADSNESNINCADLTHPEHKTTFKSRVYSMDEPHYLHMINNLCSYEDVVHTHIGFFNGGSLFAALEGNNPKKVFAIDSFFGNIEEIRSGFIENSTLLGYDGRYVLINDNCFQFDLSLIDEPVNFHLYDADHEERSQYEGIKRFEPTFDENVIVMVDNFASPHVARASDKAIADLENYDVYFRTVVERHCHQGIYVLRRNK